MCVWKEKRTGTGSGWLGRWGGPEKRRGKENIIKNLLYEKNKSIKVAKNFMLLLHICYHSEKQEEIKHEFSFGEIESVLWIETKCLGSQRESPLGV